MAKKIQVYVKLKSKKEGVYPQEDGSFIVRCHAPPVEGKANKRITELLAAHFKVSKSQVKLTHGQRGKKKIYSLENVP